VHEQPVGGVFEQRVLDHAHQETQIEQHLA
jgi:hypothetical protein